MHLIQENPKLFVLLKQLWSHISPSRRRQLFFILLLMIFGSFAEVLSIGAVIPFLGVLSTPEKVYASHYMQPLISILSINSSKHLLLLLTATFAAAAFLNGGMRLLLLWATTKLSVLIGAELSLEIYKRTLYQPYCFHITKNSSELINTITSKTNVTIYLLLMMMNFISSLIIFTFIIIALLSVDFKIALTVMGSCGVIYYIVVKATKKALVNNGKRVAHETSLVIKSLQEGLGGIRDVLLDGVQDIYSEVYKRADFRVRLAQGQSGFLSGSPRYVVEALAMILISIFAYLMAVEEGGLINTITLLGAIALGAQRMMPVMQQAYSSWANIKSNQASLRDAVELLNRPFPSWMSTSISAPLLFEKKLELKSVSFFYHKNTAGVIKNINLEINAGARIGFIGVTGSGKSTLLDLIMGLLQPTSGEIRVDGVSVLEENCRNWQRNIAHVPQSIFLTDASVEQNIAFGIPVEQINRDKVKEVAAIAQLTETINSLPDKYETKVGERGVRLSGGQKQRVGIARALYKNATMIILDEATSALDNATEKAVMQGIQMLNPNITILMVAHRVTTLGFCDKIYEISGGEMVWSGSYEQLSFKAKSSTC